MVAASWAGVALTDPNGSSGYRPATGPACSIAPNVLMNACCPGTMQPKLTASVSASAALQPATAIR